MIVKYDNIDSVYREILKSACGRQCSVVILVANEVDAMAAAKLLTHVLKSDTITFKIRPVANFRHVLDCVKEFEAMDTKSVILLNCGAIYNIPKHFNLERGGDLRVYILDNHRPIHLANIHSAENVVVLDDADASYTDIPSEGSDLDSGADSSSDEDEDDNDEVSEEPSEEEEEDDDMDEDKDPEEATVDSADGADEDEEAEFDANGDRPRDETSVSETADDAEHADEEDAEDGLEGDENDDGRVDDEGDERSRDGDEEPSERRSADGQDGGDVSEVVEEDEDVVVRGRRRKSEHEQQRERSRIRRSRLRGYYAVGVHHTYPTSVQLVNLIKLLNKPCTSEILWMAILGLTEQFDRGHITSAVYSGICDTIQAELPSVGEGQRRWRVNAGDDEVSVPATENGTVFDGSDFRFFMYRHWSLFESMLYSPYTAVKMELWKGTQGEGKLQDLYAKIGMPLQQMRQKYEFMDPFLRSEFRRLVVSDDAQQCNLREPLATFKSFYRGTGFNKAMAAADIVHAAGALLELHVDGDGSAEQTAGRPAPWLRAFSDAYDCLGGGRLGEAVLKKGVDHAIVLQKALMMEAASLLDGGRSFANSSSNRIVRLKAFRYAYVNLPGGARSNNGNGLTLSEGPFARPQMLTRLAQFVMQIQVDGKKWVGKNALPLVLLAERRNTYLVVGVVPPLDALGKQSTLQTNFRMLFKWAAEQTNHNYRCDSFDGSVLEIDRDDVVAFVENLMDVINSK